MGMFVLLSSLRLGGSTTIQPAPAVLAATWCSKRERKCIWQVSYDAQAHTHTLLWLVQTNTLICKISALDLISVLHSCSGCEVWHPLCKQAARAERRLRVSWILRVNKCVQMLGSQYYVLVLFWVFLGCGGTSQHRRLSETSISPPGSSIGSPNRVICVSSHLSLHRVVPPATTGTETTLKLEHAKKD